MSASRQEAAFFDARFPDTSPALGFDRFDLDTNVTDCRPVPRQCVLDRGQDENGLSTEPVIPNRQPEEGIFEDGIMIIRRDSLGTPVALPP
jgi:hypothetical protein